MAIITLENVPEGMHKRLVQRAEALGISLNDYLLEICEEAAEPQPSDEALDRLRDLPPYPTARIISPWTEPTE
jgi:hypothetical protein